MLALKSVAAALVALVLAFTVASLSQPKPSVDWAESLRAAALELEIELTAECMEALREHIGANGFARGAVTTRGVLVRDERGADTWLCL